MSFFWGCHHTVAGGQMWESKGTPKRTKGIVIAWPTHEMLVVGKVAWVLLKAIAKQSSFVYRHLLVCEFAEIW